MINRTHRFHGHNTLAYLFRTGKTLKAESMSLKFAANKKGTYRIAVVVSKKVHKSAVVRNRIRRRIFEIVRTYEKEQPGLVGHVDMVITVFDESVRTREYIRLKSQIDRMLEGVQRSVHNHTKGP